MNFPAGTATPATSSAPRSIASREQSPSLRPRPFSRRPSMQQVNTNLQSNVMVTPASARSTSSVAPSPYLSSVQCSPSTFYVQQQFSPLSTPAPLELPESLVSLASHAGNTSSTSRSDGLVRKLSHGAKSGYQKLRRKASSSNQSRRDVSSGPVARRRSDSKTLASNSFNSEPEALTLDVPCSHGLGLGQTLTLQDDAGAGSDNAHANEPRAEVLAPSIPKELLAGCRLVKSTRKKRQDKYFFLDAEGSRVSWSGTVSTKSFQIDNIKSIRTGPEATGHWHDLHRKDLDVENCFTINFAPSEQSNETKTLHLIAYSARDLRLWVDTLEALAKHREELMTEMTGSERQSVLRMHWDSELTKRVLREGAPSSDGLDQIAITNLCRKLHVHCPRDVIADGFRAADVSGAGKLDFEQFRSFVAHLRGRSDIKPVFDEFRSDRVDGIDRESFWRFLHVQGVDRSNPSAHAVWESRFDKLVGQSSHDDHVDFKTFAAFLASKDCLVYATTEKPRPLLHRPLNEYIVSSSHNTYLTGRQVNGTSSVEAYATALRRGCRSVEIDCWDGENDQPRVTHGFTRTTSVNFIDVCKTIDRCAFDASPYPVLLSLEVHCNPVQQARMVQIMEDVFGDKLVMDRLADHLADLPSPEDLKHKILVKVKATEAHPNLSVPADAGSVTNRTLSRARSTSSPYRRPVPVSSTSSPHQSSTLLLTSSMMSPPESFYSPTERSMTATSASSEDDDSDGNSISPVASDAPPPRVKTSKIIPKLAVLGTYLQGYSFRGPADLNFQQFNHIFSLNENTAMDLSRSAETKAWFEDHNVKHMCRVYPRGLRVNSSNFDPNTFWRRGVQMVALNFQTYDTHMQMNQAMFAAGTDQTGYVLKPEYLRKPRRTVGDFEHRLKLPRYHIRFSVKVISAQQLPRLSTMGRADTIDPFIEVQMFSAEDKARGIAHGSGGAETSSHNGYHGIGSPYSRRTRVVRGNGYNPQFNDVIELKLDTKYPELVFVRFIVYQAGKNSKQLAVFTAKLDRLQVGYRHVPLYNSHGEELIFSSLFCQIQKSTPSFVASSLSELVDQTPRQRSLRTILNRGISSERGRERGLTMIDEQRRVSQARLNLEIEERKGRAGRAARVEGTRQQEC